MISNNAQSKSNLNRRLAIFFCLLVAVVTLLVFWQIRNNEFINFDDDVYITDNRYVKRGFTLEGIIWAFQFNGIGYWQPLTWLSHMLDCQIYGLDPSGHHLTNLILHIVNSIFLFLIFNKITGEIYKSAFLAALFALHPLNVDSVAWAAERKNVLSTFFWMMTLLSYTYYIKAPSSFKYILTFIIFALGLMSKPMLVTLPFVFLLLDYWPLRRIKLFHKTNYESGNLNLSTSRNNRIAIGRKLIIEKIPFFILSVGSIFIASLSLVHNKDIVSIKAVPIFLRIGNALISYFKYVWRMIWPLDFAIFYPFPKIVPVWQVALASLFLLSVSIFVSSQIKKRPYLSVGWLWYTGTLVPVIGIMQGGLWPEMADRWAYVPAIGIFIMIVWGAPELLKRWRLKKHVLLASAMMILASLAFITRSQLKYWQNSVVLFEHNLKITKDNPVAHHNLGNALVKKGMFDEAIFHFREAIRMDAHDAKKYNNLGTAFARKGRMDEAIEQYWRALELNPALAQAHNNLGVALIEKDLKEKAALHFSNALKYKPDYAEAHNNLGALLRRQGRLVDAALHYLEAIRLEPTFAEAYNNLGLLFLFQGKYNKAVDYFGRAIEIRPNYRNAQENLKKALAGRNGN
jgi:Flp pilus assembly protein TadD